MKVQSRPVDRPTMADLRSLMRLARMNLAGVAVLSNRDAWAVGEAHFLTGVLVS